MVAHLALCISNLVLDAQLARNATFPEAAAYPVIGLGALAVSAALDHPWLFEGCPLRRISPISPPLVALAVNLAMRGGHVGGGCRLGGWY